MEISINSLLIKLTNKCNLACSYCYWFRDNTTANLPKKLTPEAEFYFLEQLERHIQEHNLCSFSVSFHGGEPLMFGYERFINLCTGIEDISRRTQCHIAKIIQTNGALITHRWCKIFRDFDISVGVSIDGPKDVHDAVRKTVGGRPSFDQVVSGLDLLKDYNIPFGVLSVCKPESHPEKVLKFFVEDLNIFEFDILIPDHTHDDNVPKISEFYKSLYDIWMDKYSDKVRIRCVTNWIRVLLGRYSACESIGYGPMSVLTIDTNGSIGPVDTLRICKGFNSDFGMNVATHSFSHVAKSSQISDIVSQSMNLSEQCKACDFQLSCGGGYLPHRWSSKSRNFQNPSVYCADLKLIFSHVKAELEKDLQFL